MIGLCKTWRLLPTFGSSFSKCLHGSPEFSFLFFFSLLDRPALRVSDSEVVAGDFRSQISCAWQPTAATEINISLLGRAMNAIEEQVSYPDKEIKCSKGNHKNYPGEIVGFVDKMP